MLLISVKRKKYIEIVTRRVQHVFIPVPQRCAVALGGALLQFLHTPT